ncbi:hypothetical protein MMC25_005696 [Agyrium rufum]|nr:hypothetical protein [Agyrium rufum]
MPSALPAPADRPPSPNILPTRLPFPPLTKQHVLNCSYHTWYGKYRSLTPKARLIPLNEAFVEYLRSDGIVVPPTESNSQEPTDEKDAGFWSTNFAITSDDEGSDLDPDEASSDPSLQWPEIHAQLKSIIQELKGSVHPKLNWSAPKDATWISATNDMNCREANDVYLLLKSSDFVTHDLEHAFDGCVDGLELVDDDDDGVSMDSDSDIDEELQSRLAQTHVNTMHNTATPSPVRIPYHLILRQTIPSLITSMEFRCFVRDRNLLCVTQRDLSYYSFLPSLLQYLRPLILEFFAKHLQDTFPDPSFVFDVYIPNPEHRDAKVWLIDINPWAERTDPLLFSWWEILSMDSRNTHYDTVEDTEEEEVSDIADDLDIRLVGKDDPEAAAFGGPRYGAHKLPKDVVDASLGVGGLKEFLEDWRNIVKKQERHEGENYQKD